MGVADGDRKQRKAMGLLRLGNPRMNIPEVTLKEVSKQASYLTLARILFSRRL